MQRLKFPFCGGQVGMGVGTTTGLIVGILVGLRDGSAKGAGVGKIDGVSVTMIDGTALGFEVGAIVPLHEPTTFQASKSPGTSPLSQTGYMHSYTIPSKDIIDPVAYEPNGLKASVQPPMNMIGCSVGDIVVDGISVGVVDGL
jgi:hypothetical protein